MKLRSPSLTTKPSMTMSSTNNMPINISDVSNAVRSMVTGNTTFTGNTYSTGNAFAGNVYTGNAFAGNISNAPSLKLVENLKEQAMDLQDAQQNIIKGFETISPYMDKAENIIDSIKSTAQTIQSMKNTHS